MKKTNTINRISIKTGTADGDLFKLLLYHSLQGEEIRIEPGLTVYSMADGTLIELYSPGSYYPEYLFKNSNIVFGFNVDSLEKALPLMLSNGATLLGRVETICNTLLYCHILSKETVVGLYQAAE